ncbi:hypothetical protein KAR52_03105 [Candidatus Pacearchaeota archaeon]|nr:hypothetical protein [Candidatus Pacearchaeota archaeon]
MVKKNKEGKFPNDFKFLLIVFVSILVMSFVFATYVFSESGEGYTTFHLYSANDTGDTNLVNITLNNTQGASASGNISQVNFTLPSAFTYITQTNGSSNITHFPSEFIFTEATRTLSWSNFTYALINESVNMTSFWFNFSVNTPGWYNITLSVMNGTGGDSFTNYSNITIEINDTAVPEIVAANITSVTSESYERGTLLLNVSIFDYGTMCSVNFTITNSSESINATYNASQTGSSWNYTINTASFPDGTYNITVYANDSAGNLNDSARAYNVVFDNTAPVTPTIESSSATITSLTLTVSVNDVTSGINAKCSVDRSGASITGTGTTQTLTETGLKCSNEYSYQVTCNDRAGNSVVSAITPFWTSSCGGSATNGGSGSSWTGTINVHDEQFAEGYTREIAVNNRMKVKVGSSYHYVGVKALTLTTATIEISSNPVEVELDIGEEAKIDVTDDGFYDMHVILNSIVNNKADITIKKIYEQIPEGEGAVATSGDITDVEEEVEEVEETNLIWLWISIGVLVVVGALAILLKMKKKSFGIKKR